MNTDCKKCGAKMRPLGQRGFKIIPSEMYFTITGYLCAECGHWNDLKRRKGFNGEEK